MSLRFYITEKGCNLSASPRKVLTLLGIGTAISLLGDATLYTVLPDPNIASQIRMIIIYASINHSNDSIGISLRDVPG